MFKHENNAPKILLRLVVVACVAFPQVTQCDVTTASLEEAFERKYCTWREHVGAPSMLDSSGPGIYDGKPFIDILALGPSIVPYLINKMNADSLAAVHMWAAVSRLTKKSFSREEMQRIRSNERMVELWTKWWKEGRRETPARFAKAYQQWKAAKAAGETTLWADETYYYPGHQTVDSMDMIHRAA